MGYTLNKLISYASNSSSLIAFRPNVGSLPSWLLSSAIEADNRLRLVSAALRAVFLVPDAAVLENAVKESGCESRAAALVVLGSLLSKPPISYVSIESDRPLRLERLFPRLVTESSTRAEVTEFERPAVGLRKLGTGRLLIEGNNG